jgi:2-keto-4-pentenoate hydratase/2-oxohepta-3-ene-1,7-dioic acid hydratase in catechol pathway
MPRTIGKNMSDRMKLFRFGQPDHERPGASVDGRRINVSEFGEDYNEAFFAEDGVERLRKWLAKHGTACPIVNQEERIAPCVSRPSKIVCVGLNYRQHAIESGMEIPKEPVLFFKATTALAGANDDVVIPPGAEKVDWEVELAVVIGHHTSHVSAQESLERVAGYCLHNDYSERAYQLERGGQWVKGKSCDTFAPLGPELALAGDVDPHNLRLWLKVNGRTMQDSNTSDFIFSVPFLISYISEFMTLLPGDVISTGTPPGVGLGFKPPRYLKSGDVVESGIDGLGQGRQRIVAYDQRRR